MLCGLRFCTAFVLRGEGMAARLSARRAAKYLRGQRVHQAVFPKNYPHKDVFARYGILPPSDRALRQVKAAEIICCAMEKLGLNESVSVQYVKWLSNAFHGEFGISYKYKMDVLEVISGRVGNTMLLGGIGFVLIFTLALLLGILCAWHEEKWLDKIICQVGTVTSCIPEFWFSLVLILFFAVELHILPSSGAYTIGKEKDTADRIQHLILPVTVVVLGHLWYYAYMIRNKILEEVRADYVLLAKSKGLTKNSILFRHCLRNIIPSYLSIMAISVPHILGGTYIVETVFSYPGLGTLAYESARYKDYNLLMVLCILTGIVVVVCNMIAQTINERIDPRIRQ